jgi:hypothetical protein
MRSAPAVKQSHGMTSPAPHLTHAPPHSPSQRPSGPRHQSLAAPDRPTWGEVLGETTTMGSVPAFFGPPIRLLLVPWLLLVLLLIGPFALIVTGLLVLAGVVILAAALVAVIASPYLLIRRVHAHGTFRGKAPVAIHVLAHHRASSRRLGSLSTKGMS